MVSRGLSFLFSSSLSFDSRGDPSGGTNGRRNQPTASSSLWDPHKPNEKQDPTNPSVLTRAEEEKRFGWKQAGPQPLLRPAQLYTTSVPASIRSGAEVLGKPGGHAAPADGPGTGSSEQSGHRTVTKR